ncbi:MAG TPA: RING finger protein [Planctomycetota bacterium]|jgi:hypothetical protein|nr:RING finger protein [Planctomycetota bacterium]
MTSGREPAPTDFVTFRRFPDGFEIALLPPPRLKCTKKDLAIGVGFGLFFLLMIGLFTGGLAVFAKGSEAVVLALAGLWVILLLVLVLSIISQFDWVRETAVLEARDGLLTLARSGGVAPRQWRLADLSSARVCQAPKDYVRWGLQLTFKNADPFFVFEGRRRAELDWIAGLLRAALAPPRKAAPVADPAVVFISGGECQVCGWAMEQWVVLCSKCRTPHHEECWTWNGACSTYGCREIRFTRSA